MAEVIKMPKMSDTMEEGVISSWLVKEGDKVSSGDILAEVETDKATMELESYEDGTILHIGIKEGDAVPVDGVIAIIGEEGEDIKSLLKDLENGGSSKESTKEASAKEEDTKDSAEPDEQSEEVDTSNIKATLITMPKMSDTMEEGTIASWLKKEGDKVESGDILAEVETDKATMELEAYEDGILLHIGVEEGDAVPVDGVLAVIGEKGADYKALLKAHQQKKSAKTEQKEAPKEEKAPAKEEKTTVASPANVANAVPDTKGTDTAQGLTSAGGRIFASPLAKKIAEDKGINLSDVKGSGDNGRIIKSDVENFVPSAKEVKEAAPAAEKAMSIPQVVGEESYEEVKVSQMRKTVGKRLSESKFTAPHFYLTMEINMDKAMEARKSINELSPVKISFNDIVIKATAAALRQHPKVNSAWLGDKIRRNNHIHIGMAVAVEEGLLVPVIRFADNKSLSHIATEAKSFAQKAKNKELQPSDWEGNTFTISNLGMFGIEEFTAIINPPDACILAVGGIKQTAIVRDGELAVGNMMKVTMSCDHRVVDGAVGSAFLQTLKGLLEDPVRILI